MGDNRTYDISLSDTEILRVRQYGRVGKHILICLHGYGATSRHPAIHSFGSLMGTYGIAVATYTVPEKFSTDISSQVSLLLRVIAYFRRRYPASAISLSGGSLGALICAIAATECGVIHTLITSNGYFGTVPIGGIALRVYLSLKIRSLWDRKLHARLFGYISGHHKPEHITVPTLVIHTPGDKVTQYTHSVTFYRRLTCPKRLYLLDSRTADHELTHRDDIRTLASQVRMFISDTPTFSHHDAGAIRLMEK